MQMRKIKASTLFDQVSQLYAECEFLTKIDFNSENRPYKIELSSHSFYIFIRFIS